MHYEKPAVQRFGTLRELTLGDLRHGELTHGEVTHGKPREPWLVSGPARS
jgi:hypothetical protein